MRKNHMKLIAAGMLVLLLMTGCGLSDNNAGSNSTNANSANENSANEESGSILSADMEDAGNNAEKWENRTDTGTERTEESSQFQTDSQSGQTEGNSQPQSQATEDAGSIEEELAAYRAEREKGVSSSGGYTMVQAPNEDNYHYGIGESNSHTAGFDSRELNEAFETAGEYVKYTLNLESEVWGCVDPRMNAIYEDEDKGVANGYDAGNIFLCEYNDHGTWKYLILVREGKGSDWEVLYHGSSYKTD